MTSPGRQFLHIPAYFHVCAAILRGNMYGENGILRACFKVRSMHLASTLYYAFMTVNIPVQERNVTCRIVASAESLTR